jgi:hypothetical protein
MRHDTSCAKGVVKLQDCTFGFMGHMLQLLAKREERRRAYAHIHTHTQKSVRDWSAIQQLNDIKEADYRSISTNGKTTESKVLFRK